MKKHLLLLATLLVSSALAGAEDEGATPRVLEMSRATVLASPGCPTALHAFLPGGKAPALLAWPLPANGPLLVLGLPGSDETAQRVADVFQLDVDADTLAGGYAVHAWRAGTRNLVFVFGADPAALQAARFEFDTSAPVEMLDPNMRSLDFKRANQQAGTIVRAGSRRVRPRFRMRALDPGRDLEAGTPTAVSGAWGNRLWIDYRTEAGMARRLIEKARAHGLEPVLVFRQEGLRPMAESPSQFDWESDKSIRRFAFVFETPLAVVRAQGKAYATWERDFVRNFALLLRRGRTLEEIVVVPRCFSDRLARTYGAPPDLRNIPEAMIAWSGPLEHSTTITRKDAERRVREAGVPVVLLDTWAAPFQHGAARERYVPSLPTGRAGDLGEVLAGVAVVGSHGTEALLESAWDPTAEPRFGASLLEQLLARDGLATAASVRKSADHLDAAAKEHLGLVRWMAPLARELRAVGNGPVLHVPILAPRRKNRRTGALDDSAWRRATSLPVERKGVTLKLLSDGASLRVAVRLERSSLADPAFLMQLRLSAPSRGVDWHVDVTPEGMSVERLGPGAIEPDALEPGHVTLLFDTTSVAYMLEITFDRFALGGDLHRARVVGFGVSFGPTNLWPAAAENGATGVLLF